MPRTYSVTIWRSYNFKGEVIVEAEDRKDAHDKAMDMISDADMYMDSIMEGYDGADVMHVKVGGQWVNV